MTRLCLALLVLVPVLAWESPAAACPLYRDAMLDVNGNVIPGVTITIKYAGTSTIPSIYTDSTCTTTKPNPTTSGSNGEFSFYVPDGEYKIEFVKSGYFFTNIERVGIYDPLGENVRTVGFYPTTDLCAAGTGAIDAIGATPMTLIINKPVTCSITKTIPSTLTVIFEGTGTITLSVSQTLTIGGRMMNLTNAFVLLGSGTYAVTEAIGTRTHWFPARALTTDGAQCADAAAVTINSGPRVHTIICTDNDAATIYGMRRMPENWDAGWLVFLVPYIQTAADTNAFHSDLATQCRGINEAPSATWGTEVPMDATAVPGSNQVGQLISGAVTPVSGCQGGDMLWFRWQVDATGTTTAMATLHILGVTMQYHTNVNSQHVE